MPGEGRELGTGCSVRKTCLGSLGSSGLKRRGVFPKHSAGRVPALCKILKY